MNTDSASLCRSRSYDKHGGFSIVELIVVVTVIGIIILIAVIYFGNVQDNARQAVVETAARDANVLVQANIIQGDADGGDLSSVESENVVVTLADTFVPGDESTVCVRADWVGGPNYAVSGPCDEADTTAPIFDREDDDPLYTTLTYRCPTTRAGYLGVVNIAEDTRAQIWEDSDRDGTIREVMYETPAADFDLRYQARQEIFRTREFERNGGDMVAANAVLEQRINEAATNGIDQADVPAYSISETVNNVSELLELEADVTYKVRFDGEIETFSAPGHRGGAVGNLEDSLADCLVGIDHFGEDINLKNMVYLGGENLTAVPDNIPPSVISLRAALENATNFNDPSIRTWDVSNVRSMRSLFFNTPDFNQPLNQWDTGNVVYAQLMFNIATGFNQDVSSWDMSSAVNIRNMFDGATSFRQDLSGWDVSNVENHNNFGIRSGMEPHHLPDFPDNS